MYIILANAVTSVNIRSDSFFLLFVVVSQPYTINVMEENVLRGNSAIMKCHIPSFVTDFVFVSAWIESEPGQETRDIYPSKTDNNYGI